jgi:hypothetical protein
MNEVNRMVHDERTYVQNIGKQDQETVREALADQGANTLLRVCLGVNGEPMPIRVLGYYASAIAVQEYYFPEAELQFVFPVHAASTVNGVDLHRSKEVVRDLDNAARDIYPRRYREDSPDHANIQAFEDVDLPDEALERAVAEVLSAETDISQKLSAYAKSRGSSFTQYVAAHVLMHDTNPTLQPLFEGGLAGNDTRVISIGAQSERPFYLARMACQRARLLPMEAQVATGQLFTRHLIPPYMSCREGEPTLISEEVAPTHEVPSVERDMAYLYRAVQDEAARYEEMTIPVEAYEYDFFGPGFSRTVIKREFA